MFKREPKTPGQIQADKIRDDIREMKQSANWVGAVLFGLAFWGAIKIIEAIYF